jgi:hypothetical protein
MTRISNDEQNRADFPERPLFPHRPWMVGLVLGLAVLSIIAGFSDPIWLLLGAPFILVLVLYIYVRLWGHNL